MSPRDPNIISPTPDGVGLPHFLWTPDPVTQKMTVAQHGDYRTYLGVHSIEIWDIAAPHDLTQRPFLHRVDGMTLRNDNAGIES